jgi:hypothetical protein
MTESKGEVAETPSLTASNPSVKAAVNVATEKVEERLLLATYVDHLAPDNYTEEAESTLLFEVRQFAEDVVAVTRMRRRADRNAEKVLRSHVLDSASFLRNKKEDLGDKLADWSKWIGFTFVGLAINQGIHVRSETTIAWGSVKWLMLDIIIATVFLFIGAVFNRPWGYLTERFRRR